MGPFFKNFQNFRVFAMRTPEIFEKWAYVSRKIPKNGYLFSAKMTLKHGYGFLGSSGRPLSKPNLSTPPPGKRGRLRCSPIGISTPVKTRLEIPWLVYIFTQVNITTSPPPQTTLAIGLRTPQNHLGNRTTDVHLSPIALTLSSMGEFFQTWKNQSLLHKLVMQRQIVSAQPQKELQTCGYSKSIIGHAESRFENDLCFPLNDKCMVFKSFSA